MASIKGLYYPLEIIQGNTLEFSFGLDINGEIIYYDDVTIQGVVRDLENKFVNIVNLQFRENTDNPEYVDVFVDAADTQNMPIGDFVYEIKITDNNPQPITRTIMYGSFKVAATLFVDAVQTRIPRNLSFKR